VLRGWPGRCASATGRWPVAHFALEQGGGQRAQAGGELLAGDGRFNLRGEPVQVLLGVADLGD
jgi:hypothetical protein